jgi:hypothetical protein
MDNPGTLMRLTTIPAIMLLLAAGLLAGTPLSAAVTHTVNEQNGLQGWRFTEGDIEIDLTRWRIHHDGMTRDLLMKEPLLASWDEADASEAARLVIRWGMFPTRQEYLPSDYNWGLTAYGIPPGSEFDLDVNWTEDGKSYTGVIRGIVCAPDVDKLK